MLIRSFLGNCWEHPRILSEIIISRLWPYWFNPPNSNWGIPLTFNRIHVWTATIAICRLLSSRGCCRLLWWILAFKWGKTRYDTLPVESHLALCGFSSAVPHCYSSTAVLTDWRLWRCFIEILFFVLTWLNSKVSGSLTVNHRFRRVILPEFFWLFLLQ